MDKPKLNEQHVIDELTVASNSLGKLDENDGTYMKDRDCKPCLREIVRYLGADSDKHVARCFLGSLNIIKSDLIPLMVQYCDYHEGDPEMFTTILRLCTNLTSSVLLLFEQHEIPTEPDQLQLHNKLLNGLHGYKRALATNDKVWSTLNTHLLHNMEDEVTFERLIILIRNILHIPVDSSANMGVQSDFDTHDMCLYRMDKSGMLDTLIKIASETQKGAEYCLHLTEIIYLMLRDQNPMTLALARPNVEACKRKLDDNDLDKKRLAELSARNRRERQNSRMNLVASRFKNTSYLVQNCRSLSDAPLILRRPLDSREMIKFDAGKVELRKAKNKKPLSSETSMSISDRNTKVSKISHSLKTFCKKFVEKVYNNYMQQIKHNLIQKKAQDDDESYYLWAIHFFIAFNRHSQFSIDNISETLSTSALHFVQILITNYQDKIKIEKKKFHETSKRLHLALRAYREVLCLIESIDSESPFVKTVESIQKNIFTETEYSCILLTLFQQYDEPKHSGHYLRDLIETNHTFLKLLEEYSRNHSPVEAEEEVEAPPEKASKKRKRLKVEFRTAHFMTRYCCPDVIKAHLDVLKDFKTNEDSTNLAVLKFFERIVYDCKYEVILYQASVFRCLLEIMSYHSSLPGSDGFKALGKHLMETFGALANKRRWMFQELLFWKTSNDALEIENAINPPAVSIVDPPTADADADQQQQHFDSNEAQPDEEECKLPADTIASLMAELHDSSDDDFDADSLPEADDGPPEDDPIEDLLAEINDDAVSEAGAPNNDEPPGKVTEASETQRENVNSLDELAAELEADNYHSDALIDIPDADVTSEI